MRRSKAQASEKEPISLVMLPFLPNISEHTNKTHKQRERTPESQECLEMAEQVNKQINRGSKEVSTVLFLGAPANNIHYKGRCLEDHFHRIILKNSMITIVAHGNPLLLGTMTRHSLTPEDLAHQIDLAIDTILNKIANNKSDASDNKNLKFVPLINKCDIKTHFDFQHCNSGLYLVKTDNSAMESFVGRFITSMSKYGYTGISASGYRGFIGELNGKTTKIFPVEGDSSKIFGREVAQLKITQDSCGFKIEHPIQFSNINIDCKKIIQEAIELLRESESISNNNVPSPPEKKEKPQKTPDDCKKLSINTQEPLLCAVKDDTPSANQYCSSIHDKNPTHSLDLILQPNHHQLTRGLKGMQQQVNPIFHPVHLTKLPSFFSRKRNSSKVLNEPYTSSKRIG